MMRHRYAAFRWLMTALMFVGVLTFLHASSSAGEEEKTLWILSGQSNACGRAALPGPKVDERVRMLDPSSGEFVAAQDPLPGMGTVGVGPWVAAAQQVAQGGVRVDMVGFASGGKPIRFWNSGQPGRQGLFPRIKSHGQSAEVFLWYQGESDARDAESAARYGESLKSLVAEVRRGADNPKMTAVIIQLGNFTRPDRDFMAMREAQRQFVVQDGNALLVPAMGRPLKDSVHLNNAGYQALGKEIGMALLARQYDQKTSWPGPVLDEAVLTEDGKQVTAHFAEVEKLSGAQAADFAAVDEQGVAKCETAAGAGTLVHLQFERPIKLPAKLIYGFGENPQATLRDEADLHAPAVQLSIQQGRAPQDRKTTAINGAGK